MSEPNTQDNVIQKVRQALGRSTPLADVPAPPAIDQSITRLVGPGTDLPKHFIKTAIQNVMSAQIIAKDDLLDQLIAFLNEKSLRRIALSGGGILEKLNLAASLSTHGFEVKTWPQMTLDELYDFDAGITDVYAAVAETGSLVVRATPQHGRALSLVPMVHIAIVEQSNLLPDLIDLYEKMTRDGISTSTTIISGPSKTSDIEMNLVVGVHGPTIVKIFLLQ